MEYPLGAETIIRPALAGPPCSGIQNPGVRRPPFTAGSQKRWKTAQVEVFSCALQREGFSPPKGRAIYHLWISRLPPGAVPEVVQDLIERSEFQRRAREQRNGLIVEIYDKKVGVSTGANPRIPNQTWVEN